MKKTLLSILVLLVITAVTIAQTLPVTDDLVVHFDASELTLNNDDPVATWPDLSGNNYDAGQVSSTLQPVFKTNILNGKPVVRFNGKYLKTNSFSAALTQPNTVFIVWNPNPNGAMYATDGLNQESSISVSATDLIRIRAATPFITYLRTGTDWLLNTALFSGEESTIWENGESKISGNIGSNALDGLTIGARNDSQPIDIKNPLNGDIAEILVYDGELSETDRKAVEEYLRVKWFPTPSTYSFDYDIPYDILVQGVDHDFDVTFENDDPAGDIGYDAVRFSFEKEGPGDVVFTATDSNDDTYIQTNTGYWGPGSGFPIAATYSATTTFTLNFSEPGTYTITFNCFEIGDEGNPFASDFVVVEVAEVPVPVAYANDDWTDETGYKEIEFESGKFFLYNAFDNIQDAIDAVIDDAGIVYIASGTYDEDVDVSGKDNLNLIPGFSLGTVNITGELTLSSSTTLEIQIFDEDDNDEFIVQGIAALNDAKLEVSVENNYVPSPGEKFVILTAPDLDETKFSTQLVDANGFYFVVGYEEIPDVGWGVTLTTVAPTFKLQINTQQVPY